MYISQDTKEVVKFLQDLSSNNLRKSNDLEILLETGASFGQENIINDLIFTGSSIWYIYEALKKVKQGDEGFTKLDVELKENISKIQSQIIILINYVSEDIIERINNIYLTDSRGAFLNIIDLSHDLSVLKNVQITMKSRK